MRLSDLWPLLCEAATGWLADNAPRVGAALAFYAAFSLAPVFLIVISLVGLVFGADAARGEILNQVRGWVGEAGGVALEAMLASLNQPGTGVLPNILGTILMVVGAVALFSELQAALNSVWNVPVNPNSGWIDFFRGRLLSALLILVCALLLLVSVGISTAIAAANSMWGGWEFGVLSQAAVFVASWLIFTLLFAIIYRVLPDIVIKWNDVWLGAAVTSLLFNLGKAAIGWYLAESALASAYGIAGSFAVLLLGLYYAAQIFLFGAELTKAYADRFGKTSALQRAAEQHALAQSKSN